MAEAGNIGVSPRLPPGSRMGSISVSDSDSTILRILDAVAVARVREAIGAVASATARGGARKRHGYATLRALRWAILAREYRPAILQLCHLMTVAAACGARADRIDRFFWDHDVNTAAAWEAWIRSEVRAGGWSRTGFRLDTEGDRPGVAIEYPDGVWRLWFARMPLLAALWDFLVETVPWPELAEVWAALARGAPNQARAAGAANRLSACIDRALRPEPGDETATAQHIGKFRAIARYLYARSGGRGGIEIDDSAMLDFWREAADAGEAGDFRRYRTVYDDFLRFLWALDRADVRRRVAEAAPARDDAGSGPGADAADDGSGPLTPYERMEMFAEHAAPFARFDEPEAREIKFLAGRKIEKLERLVAAGPHLRDLPLSLLRAETLGAEQAAAARDPRARDCFGAVRYRCWADELEALRQECETAFLATIHVIYRLVCPQRDRAAARGAFDDETAALLDSARAAFRKINRRGFTDGTLAARAGYETGLRALTEVRDRIALAQRAVRGIDAGSPDLDGWFESDRRVFSATYRRLYGGSQ